MAKKVTLQTAGIDVSGATLQVALRSVEGGIVDLEFTNDAVGHQLLVERLTRSGRSVRICLEATANYSLDVSLALVAHPRIELMVVNPKAARRFAEAQIRRAKTDKVDARSLLDFAECMPFTPWTPPAQSLLALRSIAGLPR